MEPTIVEFFLETKTIGEETKPISNLKYESSKNRMASFAIFENIKIDEKTRYCDTFDLSSDKTVPEVFSTDMSKQNNLCSELFENNNDNLEQFYDDFNN